jgi:hypothetical protein
MPLSAGTPLGPYEIRAPQGAGGTREVCRSRDVFVDRRIETTGRDAVERRLAP